MLRVCIAALVAAVALTTAASAAKDPPLPRAAGHRTVTVVAPGVTAPTEFAFLAGRLFVAGYGDERKAAVAGGVYTIRGGRAIRVPGSPHHVYGIAAAKSTLYLSTNQRLLAWSGWNGTRFRQRRVVRTRAPYGNFRAPAGGPGGVIYVGADTTLPPPGPNYSASLVTVDPATGSITVVATGMRQPWQSVFPRAAHYLSSPISTRTTSARTARAITFLRSGVARTTGSRLARRPRGRVRSTPSRSSYSHPIPLPWGSAT